MMLRTFYIEISLLFLDCIIETEDRRSVARYLLHLFYTATFMSRPRAISPFSRSTRGYSPFTRKFRALARETTPRAASKDPGVPAFKPT